MAYRPTSIIVDVKTLSDVRGDNYELEVSLNKIRNKIRPTQGAVATNALFFKGCPARFPFTNEGSIEFRLRKGHNLFAQGTYHLSHLAGNTESMIARSMTLHWAEPQAHKSSEAKPRLAFNISLDPPPPGDLRQSVWEPENRADLNTSQPDRPLFLRPAPPNNAAGAASLWTGMLNGSIAPLETEDHGEKSRPQESPGGYENRPPPEAYMHPGPPPAYYPAYNISPLGYPAYAPPPSGPYPPPPAYAYYPQAPAYPVAYPARSPVGAPMQQVYVQNMQSSGEMEREDRPAPPEKKKSMTSIVKKLMRSRGESREAFADPAPENNDPRIPFDHLTKLRRTYRQ